jgi:hypothetical protein
VSYEGRCPSCGAPVVFALGSSLLKVCEHCGVAAARKGADLVSYGKVAELIPTPSVLALGLEGGYAGAPPFRIVGRLQLDHGAGTWDEWLLGFAGETWAWLSEAQGRFHYMAEAPLPFVPLFEDIQVGRSVDLKPAGRFVVTEVRTARFVSGAGELPFDVVPGSELHYVDLSGKDGQFATLDYGAGASALSLYVGREVTLDDLGIHALPDEEDRRKKVAAEGLKCPQCAGPVEVRAPDQTQRIGCPWCGSLLDATKDFQVLEVLSQKPFTPGVPLGSQGTLGGVTFTVIGAIERSVTVESVRYPWIEHLLYEPRRGFRWLVLANGHWSFVEPINAGDVDDPEELRPGYRGQAFQHFQGGVARVDGVLGECYWAVKAGDETDTHDFVSPPHMLSKEQDGHEIHWSLGTYTTPEEVWAAFSLEGQPPERRGVAPHQVWRWKTQAAAVYTAGFMAAAAVIVLYILFAVIGGTPVLRETVQIPDAEPSAELSSFQGPFEITQEGNLQVKVTAPVSQSWLYLQGALINEDTGAVDEFDSEVSYYSGSDSDGSWTEGSTSDTRYLAAVPPGRYTLRLEPQWEPGRNPGQYEVTLKSRVPRFYQAFLAVLAIAIWPLLLGWSHMRFEVARWSESDHPWIQSSSESEDDE